MQIINDLLSGHLGVALVMGFTVASIILDAVAKVMTALGKQVPGIVGSISSIVGQILHFLNGNVSAVSSSAQPKV